MSDLNCINGCPNGSLVSIEYPLTHPFHHDGISELYCKRCNRREGRFCGNKLRGTEVEPKNCTGGTHPKEGIL